MDESTIEKGLGKIITGLILADFNIIQTPDKLLDSDGEKIIGKHIFAYSYVKNSSFFIGSLEIDDKIGNVERSSYALRGAVVTYAKTANMHNLKFVGFYAQIDPEREVGGVNVEYVGTYNLVTNWHKVFTDEICVDRLDHYLGYL